MTPLQPGALERLIQTLPPEREDPFAHLAELTPEQLIQRRVKISRQLKILEQERQAIDAELTATYSPAELRRGLQAPGGWMIKERSRSTWNYSIETQNGIKDIQKQAQRDGHAKRFTSTYLCLVQEEK